MRRDCAEDNFSKRAVWEWSKCDSTDDLQRHFDNGQGKVIIVIDKTSNVIFGHLWELLSKQAFEPCKDNHIIPGTIIVDNSEFNLAISFFQNRRL